MAISSGCRTSAQGVPTDDGYRMRGARAHVVMIGTSPATRGGVAAVVTILLQHLPRGEPARYLATHTDGSPLHKYCVAARAWFIYAMLLATGGISLLHVHGASGPSFWRKFMFILPTFVARRPVVLHWHGGGLVDFYEGSKAWQQRVIGWTFTRCRCVIALSEQWQATLQRMFPGATVLTIPNPVVVPTHRADTGASPPTLVFMGRITTAKGVDDLLKAMPAVLRAVPDCRLVVAGAGEVERCRALAAALGVAGTVEFPGWLDDDAKAALLRRSSVFVLPSHAEAMPMAVLEAMAWAVPVVATRVGGVPQAVRDGVDGLLVEPRQPAALAAALVRVLSDGALRQAMADNARAHVEQAYAADLIVPRIRQLWDEVLADTGAR